MMNRRTGGAVLLAAALTAVATLAVLALPASAAKSSTCPNGKVNFGVEPYDAGAKFTGAYKALTKALAKNLGCSVSLIINTNYTAEVEAMKAGKIDVGEFGPLGYIFAHQIAKAQPVAVFADKNGKPVTYTAAIWVPKDSPITTVADLKGHTIAFSDPGSTSGNLMPRYALLKAGLNPDKDVTIKFAGGHPQSLLALTNGQVDAAEVNSQQQATATAAGQFDTTKFRVLWRSSPIQNDPITVRGNLPAAFQAAVKSSLLKLSPAQLKLVDTELGVDSGPMVAAKDSMYANIRALVTLEHLKITDIG
jgi:phosphonate transport system substrate-binding protein